MTRQTFDIIFEWLVAAFAAIGMFATVMFVLGYLWGSTSSTSSEDTALPAHTIKGGTGKSRPTQKTTK